MTSQRSKVIEGASYCLRVKDDPKLEAYLDKLIGYYAAAQEDDGYLYTLWTARKTVKEYDKVICRPMEDDPWSTIWFAHQLYCLGHMYESGVAHYVATGKTNFLDVCKKSADLVCETFNKDGLTEPPGHQEIEIGLAKLYRVTGETKYIELAKFLLDCRHGGQKYDQSHVPVAEQDEAVGHAVRASYSYAGMAEVAMETSFLARAATLTGLQGDEDSEADSGEDSGGQGAGGPGADSDGT